MNEQDQEAKPNSSPHPQKKHKAEFVQYESHNSDKYKYRIIQRIQYRYNEIRNEWKRRVNSLIQKPQRWASEINWTKVRDDLIVWLIEAGVEGLSANFATHFLVGFDFTVATVFAHGIAIKQGINIYWRLRRDGSASRLPKKDNYRR